MEICVITLHADPTIHPGAQEGGGTHMYINELMSLLIYRKIKAVLITRKSSPGKDSFSYNDVILERLKIGPESVWKKTNIEKHHNEFVVGSKMSIEKHSLKPEIIHSVYWYSGRVGLELASIYNIPLVYTVISNGQRKQKCGYEVPDSRLFWEQRILKESSIIIAISEQEKDDLINFYSIDENKIKVVGRPVDNIFLSELYDNHGVLLPRNEPKLLYYEK